MAARSNHKNSNGNGHSHVKTSHVRGFRMYVRHHCEVCKSRVFPFDKYEVATEAPVLGRRGEPILLRSANAHDVEERLAWCWSCNQWRRAVRLTEKDFLLMYLKRKGVVVRDPNVPIWQLKFHPRKKKVRT